MATDLSATSTAWMDHWFDEERALLHNPARSFSDDLPERSIHIVPQNAWYVLGLLDRDGPGDAARAEAIVDAIVDLQYDAPGTPWHGTYARFAESPDPATTSGVEFEDYDPNWRQFLGTALTVVLRRHPGAFSTDARARAEASIERAVASEPPERVPAIYTNIAMKKAWLDVEFGDGAAGEALAAEIVEHFDRTGAFHEFNSPTYYGIDLWGLALWRDWSSSDALAAWGARLEDTLWRSIGDWYHAGLRNFAGPYSRAYGLDMGRYLAQVGLWMWEAAGAEFAPVPTLEPGAPVTFSHSHDVCFGPCPSAVGVACPDDVVPQLRTFGGERRIESPITLGRNGRRATAWMADDVMAGGESGGWDFGDWDQFVAGTIHWRTDDGELAVMRVRQPGRPSITAETGGLTIAGECRLVLHVDGVQRDVSSPSVEVGGRTLTVAERDGTTTVEVR